MDVSKVYDIIQLESKNISNKVAPVECFIVPYKNNKYILYFPIGGIISLVNQSFINKIDTDDEAVKALFEFAKKQPTLKTNYTDLKNDMTIELTTACNMRCIYCFANGGDNPKYLDWKTAKAGLDYRISRCKDKTFTLIFLGGGEPFLAFPMMKRCYEYAKKKCDKKGVKLSTSCATNGTLIIENVAKWIRGINMYVTLSFDGLPSLQNKQRPFRDGTPSNDSVEKTIKLFNKYNIRYVAHVTITKNSVKEITNIVKNLHVLGVKKCGFQIVSNWGRCSNNYLQNYYKDYNNELKTAKKLTTKYGIILVNTSQETNTQPANTKCSACGYGFVITAHKNITLCHSVTNPNDPAHKIFYYGKIIDGKIKINKKKLAYMKDRTVDNMKQCKNCFAKYNCSGGCPAESIRNAGSAFKQTEHECILGKMKTLRQLYP